MTMLAPICIGYWQIRIRLILFLILCGSLNSACQTSPKARAIALEHDLLLDRVSQLEDANARLIAETQKLETARDISGALDNIHFGAPDEEAIDPTCFKWKHEPDEYCVTRKDSGEKECLKYEWNKFGEGEFNQITQHPSCFKWRHPVNEYCIDRQKTGEKKCLKYDWNKFGEGM